MICECAWSCKFCQKLRLASVLRLQKYKKGNSARRTALQRHIRLSITQNGSDNFSSGISGKLPKIATSNVIFSRTADRIAAKFCMTISMIKPNGILQNCVHSCTCSTWNVTHIPLYLLHFLLRHVLVIDRNELYRMLWNVSRVCIYFIMDRKNNRK